jgi:ATP-binding cassette subfamily B protein
MSKIPKIPTDIAGKGPFTYWKKYISSNILTYTIGSLAVILCVLMQVFVSRNLGWLVDLFANKSIPNILIQSSKLETFYLLFSLMFISRVLLFVGRFGWRIFLARHSHKAQGMLRFKVWEHARYFNRENMLNKYSKGKLINISTSDIHSAKFLYGFTLIGALDTIFLGLVTIVAMFYIQPVLTLITLIVLSYLPFIIKKLSDIEVTLYKDAQNELGKFNDLCSQVIETIRLQRLTHSGGFWQRKLEAEADHYRVERLKAVNTSLKFIPAMGSSTLISSLLLFVIGAYFVINEGLSIGDFVTMQGLVMLLQDPLMELGWVISDWKKGMASLERVTDVYNHDMDESLFKEGDRPISNKNVLDINNLSFSYEASEGDVLKNLSFSLKQSERVGIRGAIGTGKTTLVKIMAGLERNFKGEVNFLGRPYNEYSHIELRKYISFVSQKPFLFASTIKENLMLDQQYSDKELWDSLEAAGLKNDVSKFKDGLSTQLGEWGINLSGGQKQRLTIARAIIRKPKVLFLDDCLSAVDTVTEEKILQSLNKELKDTTIVWVAHRKSTLKYCDRIVEL